MDLPELDLQGAPIRTPDCCLSLSYKLFRNLINTIPNTTPLLDHAKRETPTVLSIGSGSGLLEALFLAYINSQRQRSSSDHAMVNIEGVEVQQFGMRDHVNSYLPEQAIHTVRGSWDVTSRLQDSDVTALIFPAGTPSLRGVVFDMDGTLCEPQTYMFKEMRDVLGITKTTDILEHIDTLPKSEQGTALESIRNIEREAMKTQTPQPGLMTLMAYLDANAIPKAICTRNFDVPVQNLMEKFLEGSRFHPIVTRDFRPPKPDPAGILHIAKNWGLHGESGEGDASGLIMVGDSIDDMTAGRMAGAATVLLVNDVNRALAEHAHTDLVITTLDELVDILEQGFVGRDAGPE
ncbi:hypothetical protein FOVSG1_014426 [Fusarium oxysporum f. sp. vasinfectum]